MTIRTIFRFVLLLGLAAGFACQKYPGDRELTAPNVTDLLPVDDKVQIGKLENGITYYIRKNEKPENRVELRLAIDAGSILEEDDQQGLAHFLEHMAFNGTTHFEANDLISYLESIGARFGADLNAYTSFDETVYILEIPTDKEGLVEQGVLVLSDWAQGIALDPEEVEKERGVVLEEWRLGQGASQRLRRTHWPVLLGGSRYGERLPIGKPEVIQEAPVERLRDFYTTWYRPDLMAVVAVGDIEPAAMEALIREHFSGISMPESPAPRPIFDVPEHVEIRASAATDKEMPYSQVMIAIKNPKQTVTTRTDYRRQVVAGLLSGMVNARIQEILERPDAPFLNAAMFPGSPFRAVDMFQAFAFAPEGKLEEALLALLTEIQRVQIHGFGEGELERAKADLMSSVEKTYNERDKTESRGLANEYVRNFLVQEPIPGIETEYVLTRELLDQITLEEVQAAASLLVHSENMVVIASEPEKDTAPATTPESLLAVAEAAKSVAPDPYEDTLSGAALLSKIPEPGSVVSRWEDPDLGATLLTLSNGVEVMLKPTDFKNDEVVFSARAPGGTSLAAPEDYPSASLSVALVQEGGLGAFTPTELDKMTAGKLVGVSPNVGNFVHGIGGSSTPRDLETALQLVHLYFTAPNERPEAFQVLMERFREVIKNREANPNTRYSDRVQELLYDDHYMFQPVTREYLDRVEEDKAWAFYRRLYADASDFRFHFAGAFDPEALEPLLTRYLGSLPSQRGTPPAFRDVGVKFPAGVQETNVYAGTEPKSQTQISWPALTGLDEMEMFYLRKAQNAMQIRLREILREELGGTYSVSVGYNGPIPYPHYGSTTISFGCAPENAERLKKTVLEEVARFKREGPTEDEVHKVTEQELRSIEENVERNGYWVGSLSTLHLLGWDPGRILAREERARSITGEILRETISRYYPQDNFVAVTMLPESERPEGE